MSFLDRAAFIIGWVPSHNMHLTFLDLTLREQLKVGSPAYLTRLAFRLQKPFVWPYRWQLIRYEISRLECGGSNFTVQPSACVAS